MQSSLAPVRIQELFNKCGSSSDRSNLRLRSTTKLCAMRYVTTCIEVQQYPKSYQRGPAIMSSVKQPGTLCFDTRATCHLIRSHGRRHRVPSDHPIPSTESHWPEAPGLHTRWPRYASITNNLKACMLDGQHPIGTKTCHLLYFIYTVEDVRRAPGTEPAICVV